MRFIADKDGHWVPLDAPPEARVALLDDIEFQSPDGARIGSRSAWREHLKRTDTVEMGHSEIAASQRNWTKKREAFAERLKQLGAGVAPVNTDVVNAPDYQMSRINQEVANRLYNRPAPDRKTLVKLTLETARQLSGRR